MDPRFIYVYFANIIVAEAIIKYSHFWWGLSTDRLSYQQVRWMWANMAAYWRCEMYSINH